MARGLDGGGAALALGCFGIAVLTIMDAVVKALAARYPVFEIVCLRGLATALCLLPVIGLLNPTWPSPERWLGHALRAVLSLLATACFFYALGQLPLAEVFALNFLAPLVIALFGVLFLDQSVSARVAMALALGFAGMLVIVAAAGGLGGTAPRPPLALAAALLAPVIYAASVVLLKSQTANEPVPVILTVQMVCVALFAAPMAAPGFRMPDMPDALLFASVGVLSAAALCAFTAALKALAPARFAILEYSGLIWAAIIGYVIFDEVPPLQTGLGAALIIGGCLLVVREKSQPAG